jgi:acyl-CoA dehydrogenase
MLRAFVLTQRRCWNARAIMIKPSISYRKRPKQGMLADCAAEALAARSMVEAVTREYVDGRRIIKQSACCKYFATEALGRIADRVLQIHGGYGYIKEYTVERLYRDARLLRIYEGTSQIQQLVIARELTKEKAAS